MSAYDLGVTAKFWGTDPVIDEAAALAADDMTDLWAWC
jgi:hypothetical protein